MIKILIITDDIFYWGTKILDGNFEYTIKNGIVFVDSWLFSIVITSEIDEESTRQRWNTIILDKDISKEIYQRILLPSLSPIIDLRNYDKNNIK